MKEPTFNQINDQLSSAYRRRSRAFPSVLIERTDRTITVGNLEPDTRNVLFSEDGQDKVHPNVTLERPTDEHQAELATKLTGSALRGAELDKPADVASEIAAVNADIDALMATMLESDKVPAWHYATALYDYETNRAENRLSPRGVQQAKRMRELYKRRQQLEENM